jgi:hypothetical protein
MAKGDSAYTRQPKDKVTLEECQALIGSKFEEQRLGHLVPARIASRYALIASGVAVVLAFAALIVAVLK